MSTLRRSSSSYSGFADGIIVRGMPLLQLYPGNVFWVDENGGGGSKGTFSHPVASIDAAMSLCTASNGDIIVVKPGHVENISAAGDLTCDVADVAIIGTGAGSNQAKIVFDTADTADIDVSAANVSFVNMWFEANFANVDGAIDVAATGDYFTIQGCRFTASAAATDYEEVINLAAGANYFSFINNDVHLIEATDGESLVLAAGESLGMRVIGNNIVMEASTSIFDMDATAVTGAPIFRDNFMVNLTAAADYCVEIDSTTVAFFVNERYGCAGAAEPVTDGSASFFINCVGVDAVAVQGIAFPKATPAWP